MNKTAIKNFAIWARNKLIADVSYDARLIGITEDGIAKPLPQSFGGTQFFDIGTAEPYSISGEAVRQRDKLIEVIQQKEKDTDYKTAYQYVIEEVAYTWFNRLIAIRFMEVNDYLPSHIRVLSSESGKLEPDLVTTPFDAELPFTAEEEAQIFQLKQDNKLDEVFRILFLKQCNALNEILPALFEKTKNYTELLLSLSVIDQDGVVYHLIHDIPEDDFNIERGGQVEIIGWLYQYYNTEPKAAAFAKNGKITKEEIPAVTQLFTPDWIVRYMVENSLGRLWVEGHPDCDLKENWKYYLEEAQQEPEVQAKLSEIRKEYAALNPEDIKLIDPCMGSGHILVYAFDVLMQIYESAGYSQRDAAKSILEHNIYGLDIDDRAYQLAYFAVMMKARQYNRRILNGENTCHEGVVVDEMFFPDADNVIPITDEEYLDDDIVSRLCAWLKAVYGDDTLEANLDYIAKALGNKGSTSREIIRNYFLNDFFKDHCQTYSVTGSGKRPIYWLFDSGKQNGFKALVYLHRYTPDTIGNLRIDYLHKMQRVYESEINRMQDMMDHSENAREVAAASKRKDKLAKQLKECREYDEKISHLALSRIELDLDDGVKVNYRKLQTAQDGKFYEVLADSKNIMVKEKK